MAGRIRLGGEERLTLHWQNPGQLGDTSEITIAGTEAVTLDFAGNDEQWLSLIVDGSLIIDCGSQPDRQALRLRVETLAVENADANIRIVNWRVGDQLRLGSAKSKTSEQISFDLGGEKPLPAQLQDGILQPNSTTRF